jgi:hypothetical protein
MMMFAVSGCFRDGMAGVSWEVKSQTARYRDAAARQAPGHDPALLKPAISSSKCRSPVMDVIAWIVLGVGADLLANMLIRCPWP